MEFLCTDHSRLRYPRCIRVCKMAPIQKVLLRMLFQLELLTLLNLERDFDIVGPREEKRATKRRQERERGREREDGKKEERFGYRFVVASRILNIIGAKKHELKGYLRARQGVLNADQYLWTLPANAIFRKSDSRRFGSARSVTSRTLKIIVVFFSAGERLTCLVIQYLFSYVVLLRIKFSYWMLFFIIRYCCRIFIIK